MKVSEALAILEALDSDQEVTLLIGNVKLHKLSELPKTANAYLPSQVPPTWHTGGFWTPYRNEITCKLH